MLAVVNCGHGGFGIGITRSRLISNSHSSGASQPPDVVFFVTVNLLSPLTQPLYPAFTVTGPGLISGHGGLGIGMTRSRLISNVHSSAPHGEVVVFLSTVNLLPPVTHPSYPVFTVTGPGLISGHGGLGIGITRSRLISNSHGASGFSQSFDPDVTVTLLPPVTQPS